ncbi:Ig-like domain-containing protein [Aeromonas phage 4L372XY]|uniref:Ig-like domain-containing protein n=1 Tax=Aeromonas phage 4L372XY TaxID=2588520 RepID=A0A5B9N3Q8_9CAUD|nr:tail fiber protein [Aeromonas phage 4L372XY]QEG08797.1 Ig-like domain-containing protein [Aeromonas phage 4L372XY]
MAQPVDPLIVWASEDVILPNAQRPNKSLPPTSLIETGWDLSQKPAADEWNYLLNNNGQYIKWLIEEKINEFLKKSENLNDLDDKATARTNLGVFSIAQVNSKTISAGNGLTGGGDLSANRTISIGNPSTVGPATSNTASGTTHTHALDVTGNVAILTGTISNGGTIPLPSGYSEAQCKWVAIPSNMSDDGNNDMASFQVTTSGRVVTVLVDGAAYAGNYATYVIIGVK